MSITTITAPSTTVRITAADLGPVSAPEQGTTTLTLLGADLGSPTGIVVPETADALPDRVVLDYVAGGTTAERTWHQQGDEPVYVLATDTTARGYAVSAR